MSHQRSRRTTALAAVRSPAVALLAVVLARQLGAQAQRARANEFNDSHFHLTNYIQQGTTSTQFLQIMGTSVGRVDAVRHSAAAAVVVRATPATSRRPTTCRRDAPLYYYSFTDAYIAMAYRSLTPAEQARFDPMITGFNPADMYAADHIRRVLHDVPRRVLRHRRVHASTRSSCRRRSPGETASLTEPGARPRPRLRGRGRAGRDHPQRHRHAVREAGRRAGVPDADEGAAQAASEDDDHLGAHRPRPRRAPGAGVGDAAERSPNHVEIVEAMLADPAFAHLNFDISWDEVAKYAVASPQSIARVAADAEQPISRPLPVRHRHRGAGDRGGVLRGRSTCARRSGAR